MQNMLMPEMFRSRLLIGFSLAAVVAAAAPSDLSAQTTPPSPAPLHLTVDQAVTMALDQNLELSAARLDPQISDTRVAAAVSAFRPVFSSSIQRNNQLQPPSSFLIPTATRTDLVTSTMGLSQRLRWLGTSYSVSWDASHTDSNSFLNSYNPLVRSGLALHVSQPLIRDLLVDSSRLQVTLSQQNRSIEETRLDETVVQTTANVKSAYWNLASAIANVEARRLALTLAEELARVNRAKVEVGQSPPLDLLSAQAEVAANQEQLIIAETAVRRAEDRLRVMIFDATDRDVWAIRIEPIDLPPSELVPIDVDSAVGTALRERGDLVRARTEIENADAAAKFARNQTLPDVRLNASYQAGGLGGTQVLRSGGFPGTIVGGGEVVTFGSVVNQVFRNDYPTWAVGLSVDYPLGGSAEAAADARARLERARAVERAKSAEAHVIQQIRDAAWKVEMNAKRIATTRALSQLAEQRLDAENKRLDVGMSTSFLVIQAQRDFAQARTSELSAILAYDLALVEFEALQKAAPAGQSAGAAAAPATSPGS
jgi:outer membrane protein TolC